MKLTTVFTNANISVNNGLEVMNYAHNYVTQLEPIDYDVVSLFSVLQFYKLYRIDRVAKWKGIQNGG